MSCDQLLKNQINPSYTCSKCCSIWLCHFSLRVIQLSFSNGQGPLQSGPWERNVDHLTAYCEQLGRHFPGKIVQIHSDLEVVSTIPGLCLFIINGYFLMWLWSFLLGQVQKIIGEGFLFDALANSLWSPSTFTRNHWNRHSVHTGWLSFPMKMRVHKLEAHLDSALSLNSHTPVAAISTINSRANCANSWSCPICARVTHDLVTSG